MVVSVRTPLAYDGSRLDLYDCDTPPLPDFDGEFDFGSEPKPKTRKRKAKVEKKPAPPPPPPVRLSLGKVVSK